CTSLPVAGFCVKARPSLCKEANMLDSMITPVNRRRLVAIAGAVVIAFLPVLLYLACDNDPSGPGNNTALFDKNGHGGRHIFRYDPFGDDEFWTNSLHMNDVIEQAVDPTTALKLGLKVDADALPPGLLASADLTSPATTVALLKLNAVVGLVANVDSRNHI